MPLPGFLAKIFGGPIVEKVLDRIPDPNARKEAREELELALLEAATQAANAQSAINAQEAQHASVFVAGWRPFIGWVCGSAFALTYVIFPLVNFGMQVAGKPAPDLPVVWDENMMYILGGMLGLGGLRTYEKLKGVARNK